MTTEIRWSFPLWTSNLRESRFSRFLENFFHISPLDLDLEAFQFHFHFSKIKNQFTFHFKVIKSIKVIKNIKRINHQ